MIIVTMVAALGLSFAYTWDLTLLILGFAPFLMLAGMAQMQIFANLQVIGDENVYSQDSFSLTNQCAYS